MSEGERLEVERVTDSSLICLPPMSPAKRRLEDVLNSVVQAILTDFEASVYERVLVSADWTVVDDVEGLAAWEPVCGCDDCRDAKARAMVVLADQPDLAFALGSIVYDEIRL